MKPPLGLAYVPEERRIVQGLSVRKNLRLALVASPGKKGEIELIEDIARIFPRLAERLDQGAVTMSGGEQQMLAIARAMIAKPDLIMLDEPSEGIMPVLVDERFALFRAMKAQGTTVLLVEQNGELALDIADPGLCAGSGRGGLSGRRARALGRQRDQGTLLLGVIQGRAPPVLLIVFRRC